MADINKRVNIIRAARNNYIGSAEEARAAIRFVTDLVHIQLKEMREYQPWAEDSIKLLKETEMYLNSLDVDLEDELDELD